MFAINDIIIADVNVFWQFIRGATIACGTYMILAMIYHLIRRWRVRRMANNLLLIVVMLLVANGISNSIVRWEDDVSFRLVPVFLATVLGAGLLVEPNHRRDSRRKEGDIL